MCDVAHCWQMFWRKAKIEVWDGFGTPEEVLTLVRERMEGQLEPFDFDRQIAIWILTQPDDAGPRVIWISRAQDNDESIFYVVEVDGLFDGARIEFRDSQWIWCTLPNWHREQRGE